MESVWSVSKLSTESVGSRRELVAYCVHTADDANATKQFRRVGGVFVASVSFSSPRRRRCVLGFTDCVLGFTDVYSHVSMYRYVMLNGNQRLTMPSDTQLPTFTPVHLEPGSKVTLPPVTFGFFVFPKANIKICDP